MLSGFKAKMFNIEELDEPDEIKNILIACNEQIKIGTCNLLRGLLAIEFKSCQKHYWKTKNRNGDIDQWMRKMIKNLHNFGVNIWKDRCIFVHEVQKINQGTRLRQSALDLQRSIESHKWRLKVKDRHLMKRSKGFFSNASETTVKAWIRRVNEAMEESQKSGMNGRYDIRNWLTKTVSTSTKPKRKQPIRKNDSKYPTTSNNMINDDSDITYNSDNNKTGTKDMTSENTIVRKKAQKNKDEDTTGSMKKFISEYVGKFYTSYVPDMHKMQSDSEHSWIVREYSFDKNKSDLRDSSYEINKKSERENTNEKFVRA